MPLNKLLFNPPTLPFIKTTSTFPRIRITVINPRESSTKTGVFIHHIKRGGVRAVYAKYKKIGFGRWWLPLSRTFLGIPLCLQFLGILGITNCFFSIPNSSLHQSHCTFPRAKISFTFALVKIISNAMQRFIDADKKRPRPNWTSSNILCFH